MTRIYVAAASYESELARSYMKRLEDAGFEIAHNWVAVIDSYGGIANPMGDKAEGRKLALDDVSAVAQCDVFWLLDPGGKVQSIGIWVELGAAIMTDRTIYVLTAAQNFNTHEEAFSHIVATWDERSARDRCPPHHFCLDPNSHTGQSCTRCNATG